MKKLLMAIISYLLLVSCSKNIPVDGNWKLEIKLQDQILPVLINLKTSTESPTKLMGTMINSTELIPLEGDKSVSKLRAHEAQVIPITRNDTRELVYIELPSI